MDPDSLLGGKQQFRVHRFKFTMDFDSKTDTYFVDTLDSRTGLHQCKMSEAGQNDTDAVDAENNILCKPEIIVDGRVDSILKHVTVKSPMNSSKNMPRFSSNDMVHNHYLDVAKKKIRERDINSTTSVPTSARIQTTTDDSKANPRSNNQTSRSLHVSKSSRVMITAVPKEDHSKSSSSFSDSKNFIFTGHRFSPNKTSAVYEKTSPRSDLRWKPTGRIFESVGLRWIPTGKLFDSCTSKVDSEPPHGSNVDIPNSSCMQTISGGLDDGVAAVLQPHSSEVGFINHMLILKLSKLIVQHQDS
ncbi:hypothetical protein Tco_1283356 [Tanacetum coccineum]